VRAFLDFGRFFVSLSTSVKGWIGDPASAGRAWPSRVRTPRFFLLARGLRLRIFDLDFVVVGAMVRASKEVVWDVQVKFARRFHRAAMVGWFDFVLMSSYF